MGPFVHKAQLFHDPPRTVIPDEDFSKNPLGTARSERFIDQSADRFGRVAFAMRIHREGVANVDNLGVVIHRTQAHATNVSA